MLLHTVSFVYTVVGCVNMNITVMLTAFISIFQGDTFRAYIVKKLIIKLNIRCLGNDLFGSLGRIKWSIHAQTFFINSRHVSRVGWGKTPGRGKTPTPKIENMTTVPAMIIMRNKCCPLSCQTTVVSSLTEKRSPFYVVSFIFSSIFCKKVHFKFL